MQHGCNTQWGPRLLACQNLHRAIQRAAEEKPVESSSSQYFDNPRIGRREDTMTLAPLLSASPAIQFHAVAAMMAFGLGVVQLAAPKGTLPHRTIGWIWVVLMLVVSVSAFFIHQIRLWGPWSPIHLLAIFTLVLLPIAVWNAHRHKVQKHRNSMVGLFVGALVIAGAFTFMPGRIMYAVAFGP
jgi:uncharacterized membrane protein